MKVQLLLFCLVLFLNTQVGISQQISMEAKPIQFTEVDSTFILGQPEMVIEEQFHDFGLIVKGERPKHTFEIYNRGTAPMKIDMVSACECTEVDWTRSLIYPGEKGHILAEYDSSDKEGEQEVTLDIVAYKMLPGQDAPKEQDVLLNQARFRAFIKLPGQE